MPLVKNNNNDNSKLFILKPRTQNKEKEKVEPYFEVNAKNEQGKWVEVDAVPGVEGNLTRLDVKEGEYEGQKTYNVSVFLKDPDGSQTFLVDLKLNMLSRGLLNSILNLSKYEDVKFGLYTGKNGYPNVSVRQHGELTKWKYSLDEMPKPEEVKFKGKIQRDYSAVDEFFVTKLKEFGETLSQSNFVKSPVKEKVKKVEAEASQPVDPDLDGAELDDVPF